MAHLSQTYDVLIVGFGPVGAVLANLLGAYGRRVAVIERDTTVFPVPRAVHGDDETARILQATGLMDELAPAIGDYNKREYLNAKGEIFFETFLPEAQPYGHRIDFYFHQPTMDTTLRAGVQRFATVDRFLGFEATALRQTESEVALDICNRETQETQTIRGRYLVGCDGGRSFVRKSAEITLNDLGFDQPWLVVDVYLKPGETTATANLPTCHRQICDPAQPISYIPCGVKGHYRWEFMLKDEQPTAAAQHPDNVRRLLSLVVDPDKVDVARAAVYTFHSLVAHQFRKGRVFLAGDAAHQMPPFAGQGMCCGLRDVHNLAWKLALVLGDVADEALLDSYAAERIPHVTRMTRGTMLLGGLVQTQNRLQARMRDLLFKTVLKLPSVFGRIANFALRPPNIDTGVLGGTVKRLAGTRFIQPKIQQMDGTMKLFDDAVGNGFVVLGYDVDMQTVISADLLNETLPLCIAQLVADNEGTLPENVVGVLDPYQALTRWFRTNRVRVVIIRPDRYVFGAYRLEDLAQIPHDLQTALHLKRKKRVVPEAVAKTR